MTKNMKRHTTPLIKKCLSRQKLLRLTVCMNIGIEKNKLI